MTTLSIGDPITITTLRGTVEGRFEKQDGGRAPVPSTVRDGIRFYDLGALLAMSDASITLTDGKVVRVGAVESVDKGVIFEEERDFDPSPPADYSPSGEEEEKDPAAEEPKEKPSKKRK